MRFFSNISDILSADLPELARQRPDPQKVLEQAIRDIHEAILDLRKEIEESAARETSLASELERHRYKTRLWHSRVLKALKAGDDELARKALARKHEHERITAVVEDRWTAVQRDREVRKRNLEVIEARLVQAEQALQGITSPDSSRIVPPGQSPAEEEGSNRPFLGCHFQTNRTSVPVRQSCLPKTDLPKTCTARMLRI